CDGRDAVPCGGQPCAADCTCRPAPTPVRTSTPTATTTPTATPTGAPSCVRGNPCGDCGDGFCVDHCNGTTSIGTFCVTGEVGPHCFTDADCQGTAKPFCISNGFCGGPGTAATCRALCEPPPSCTPAMTCGECGTGFCVDRCNGTSVTGEMCVTGEV